MVRAHDWFAAGHGLEDRDRQPFHVVRGQREDVRALHQGLDVVAPTQHLDAIARSLICHHATQALEERTRARQEKTCVPARPADLERRLDELDHALLGDQPRDAEHDLLRGIDGELALEARALLARHIGREAMRKTRLASFASGVRRASRSS